MHAHDRCYTHHLFISDRLEGTDVDVMMKSCFMHGVESVVADGAQVNLGGSGIHSAPYKTLY